jgi:hypothetical protein
VGDGEVGPRVGGVANGRDLENSNNNQEAAGSENSKHAKKL